jgi:protein-tyrosine phosphatase
MNRIGILFVCLGNICRSPTAQGVLEHTLQRHGLSQVARVDSCGTAAFNTGKPPDPRAVTAATQRGYRIESQRARQIADADFRQFRHIIAMDQANLRTLQTWAPADYSGEIRLLMHFARRAPASEVADPYYGSAAAFDAALDAIEIGVAGLFAHLQGHYGWTGAGPAGFGDHPLP